MYLNPVVTFVFVEYCERRGGGVGVPQPDGSVGGAGEEALVCAAVHQTPHRVGVSTQLPAQHWRVWKHGDQGHLSCFAAKNHSWFNRNTRWGYRRSRRGRCSGWACSSTGWCRRPLRWNTVPLYCSSPHSVQRPCCVLHNKIANIK